MSNQTPRASDLVLVPREPTDEMCKAIWDTQHDTGEKTWAAVLAAAPQPPALGGEPEVLACAVFAKNGNIRCWSSDCTAVGLKASADAESPIIELIDRARVAPLLAEIERLKAAALDVWGELGAAQKRIAELEAGQKGTQKGFLKLQKENGILRGTCKAVGLENRALKARIVELEAGHPAIARVVLPSKRAEMLAKSPYETKGWNACIDATAKLNGVTPDEQ